MKRDCLVCKSDFMSFSIYIKSFLDHHHSSVMQKEFFYLEPFNLNFSKHCRTNIVQNGGDHIEKMKRHFKGGIVQILGNIFAIVFVESWNSQIHDMPCYQNFLCTILAQKFSLYNIVTENQAIRSWGTAQR